MTVQDVWDWLNRVAPFETQESFDNAGLVLGNPKAEVCRVLFAMDATLPVVQEATQWGANLIVTHHPLLFGGANTIRCDQPEGAAVAAVLQGQMSLIAAHTNLDKAAGGTGDSLAAALGLTDVKPAAPSEYLRSGTLSKPQTALAFLGEINRRLGAHARLYGNPETIIRQAVVGAGAIGEEYAVASEAGAQAFVVGEIKHHQLLGALALGLTLFEAGHYETELPGLTTLYQRFQSDAQIAHWPVQARLTAIKPYDCATV